MRIRYVILALGLAAVLLTGCGEEEAAETAAKPAEETAAKPAEDQAKPAEAPPEPAKAPPKQAEDRPKVQSLAVSLAGWEGAESASFLMADRLGYFGDSGLSALVLSPASKSLPIEYVVNGTDQFGVSHLPQVVMAKERGAPIVAVGSLVPQTTAAVIWLRKSKIRNIADLKGKTVVFPGLPFQKAFLESLLARAGLAPGDVEVRRAEQSGYELVPDLLSGRADAIFGSWNVEGAELKVRGLDPVITRVGSLGVPAYDELVLIARTDLVSEEPRLVRDFMSVLGRGTAAAIDDPKGVVGMIEASGEANPESSHKAVKAEVEATLPLLFRTGRIDPGRVDRLVDWMFEEGLIKQKPPASALFTNDYLP